MADQEPKKPGVAITDALPAEVAADSQPCGATVAYIDWPGSTHMPAHGTAVVGQAAWMVDEPAATYTGIVLGLAMYMPCWLPVDTCVGVEAVLLDAATSADNAPAAIWNAVIDMGQPFMRSAARCSTKAMRRAPSATRSGVSSGEPSGVFSTIWAIPKASRSKPTTTRCVSTSCFRTAA